MATLSQSTATIDGARNLAVVDIEQGERFVLPVRFKTAGQNDDISSWVFSLTAETALAYVETDTAGNTTVRDAVPVEPMNPVVLPKVEVSSLEPSTVDIVLPPDLFTDEIMFDPLRAPVVVLYFRVQKGSAVDEPPVDIHRIPVVIRRGQKLDAPQSSTGPTLVVTGAQIRDQLQMLSGEQRLDASAIKNIPTGGGGLNQAGVDGRINELRPVAYSQPEKDKLAGIEDGATADQSATEIKDSLETLSGNDRLAASAVKDIPTGGLDQAAVDARITALRPVAFSSADETKLDGIENNATADQSATEIRDSLQTLSGNARLDASAVKNIPTGGGGLNQAGVDARIQALRPNPFTDGDETKLDGIENNATADQSATEIRDAIQGLSGANRLSYNNLKDQPTIPTPRTNAEIDARVVAGTLAEARAGNTGRWAKAKVPSDTVYTATQRFTSADETKLDGIAAGAEVNVQSDWNASSGDAQILNKPTIPAAQVPSNWDASTGVARILNKPTLVTAFTGLSDTPSSLTGQGGKYAAVNAGATALEFVDAPTGGGGGSTARSFLISARPSADITLAASAQLTWSAWTEVEATPELAAAHAGNVVVAADFEVMVTPADDTGGGGDRCITEARLVRTRGSVDTVLIGETIYGPRNGSNFGASGTNLFKTASREASATLVWHDSAMAGDVYKLEARTITQRTSPTKTFTFHRANNGLLVFPVGATYVVPPSSITISSFTSTGGNLLRFNYPALVLPADWFAAGVSREDRTLDADDSRGQNLIQRAGQLRIGFNNNISPTNRRFAAGKSINASVRISDGTTYSFTNAEDSNGFDIRTVGIRSAIQWPNRSDTITLYENRATILPMTITFTLVDA